MNNLKFRAKANINDEWIYASNIHNVILDDTNEKLWVMHPKGEKIEHLGDGYIKYRPLVVDEKTIGQYTGLKDKNGREIYVGDIIDIHQTVNGYNLFVVTFEKGSVNVRYAHDMSQYEYDVLDLLDWHKQLSIIETENEVVGNIHENSELLEVH